MNKLLAIEILIVWVVAAIGGTLFFSGLTYYMKGVEGLTPIMMITGGTCLVMAIIYSFFMFLRDIWKNGE